MEIRGTVKQRLNLITKVRRDLHKIPEKSREEFDTQAYICGFLSDRKIKYKKIHTGVVADFAGISKDKRIAFRADTDALPIIEKTDVDYKSTNGFMHACGHDGHTAVLLGFAKYLFQNPPKSDVVLVFQPAEEGGKGAKPMIESGLCDADVYYALHIDPMLETGKIGCAPGEFMAGRERFEITVTGLSRHTSLRDGKRDAVLACARLVCETRYLNGADFIFQANIIQGGTAPNVIADTATLTGTVRYFNEKVLQQKYNKLKAIMRSIEATDDVKIKIKIGDASYPPLVNTADAFERIKRLDGFVLTQKRFTAEDFSLFISKYSGALIWLGAKLDGHPLHSNEFNFDENALANGVQVFKQLLTSA